MNPITEGLKALSLHPTTANETEDRAAKTELSDLQFLQQHGIIDGTGALTQPRPITLSINESTGSRIVEFLSAPRTVTVGVSYTLQDLVITCIHKLIDAGYYVRPPKIVGEEFFKLLGADFLINSFAAISHAPLSDTTKGDLIWRTETPITAITVRFDMPPALDARDRHAFVERLYRELAAQFANTYPFGKHSPYLSGIVFDTLYKGYPQKINFVFACKLESEFVATCDAVQLILGPSHFYLYDNGIAAQSLVDIIFSLLRIPTQVPNISKVILHYLKQGYRPATNELEHVKRERLDSPSLYTLVSLCSELHSAQSREAEVAEDIALIAEVAALAGYEDLSREFALEAMRPYSTPSSQTGRCLALYSQTAIPFLELKAIVSFIDACMSTNEHFGCRSDVDQQVAHLCLVRHIEQVANSPWFRALTDFPKTASNPKPLPSKLVAAWLELDATSLEGYLAKLLLFRSSGDTHLKGTLICAFAAVINRSSYAVRILLAHTTYRVLSERGVYFPGEFINGALTEQIITVSWIEALLQHPDKDIQRLAWRMLLALPGHKELKLKWLETRLATPGNESVEYVLKMQADLTEPEMARCIEACKSRSYLIGQLASLKGSRWLSLCARADSQATFQAYAALKARNPQQARAILSALLEHGHVTSHMLSSFAAELVALVQASNQEENLEQVTSLIDSYRKKSREPLTYDLQQAIVTAFARHPAPTQTERRWFLERLELISPRALPDQQLRIFLAIFQQEPALINESYQARIQSFYDQLRTNSSLEPCRTLVREVRDRLGGNQPIFEQLFRPFIGKERAKAAPQEAPVLPQTAVQQLKALLKKRQFSELFEKLLQQDGKETNIKNIFESSLEVALQSKPVYIPKSLPELLEHFGCVNVPLWLKLLKTLDIECHPALSRTIGSLYRMRSDATKQKMRAIWPEILQNPQWLISSDLLPLLQDRQVFREIIRDLYPDHFPEKWDEKKEEEREVLWKTNEPWQVLVRAFLCLFLKDKSPKSPFRQVTHDWFSQAGASLNTFALGCTLIHLTNSSDSDEQFLRDCKLLEIVAPCAKACTVVIEQHLKSAGRKPPAAIKRPEEKPTAALQAVSTAVIRNGLRRLQNPEVLSALDYSIRTLAAANSSELDEVLLRELMQTPALAPSLIEVLKRRILRINSGFALQNEIDKSSEVLIHYLSIILPSASLQVLAELYVRIFVNESCIPSRISNVDLMRYLEQCHVLKRESLSPQRLKMIQLFAQHYIGYLKKSLKAEESGYARVALDVDLSLSFFFCQNIQDMARPSIEEHKRLRADLYLRLIEEFGWCEETLFFGTHTLFDRVRYLRVTPEKHPETIRAEDVLDESYEISLEALTSPRTYASHIVAKGLDDKNISFTRLYVCKRTDRLLPSETEFLKHSSLYLEAAFDHLRMENRPLDTRIHLLDYIAQALRMLIEHYPTDILLPGHLFTYVVAVEKKEEDDPFYRTHCRIALGLLRAAFQKGVISARTQAIDELLCHLNKCPADLSSENMVPLEQVECQIDALSSMPALYNPTVVIPLHRLVIEWQETAFVGNFRALTRCRDKLFGLWEKNPELFKLDAFFCSVDALFMTSPSPVLGMGRGTEARAYALTTARNYFDLLARIYHQARLEADPLHPDLVQSIRACGVSFEDPNSLSRIRILYHMIIILRKAFRQNTFDGQYREFASMVTSVIHLVFAELVASPVASEDAIYYLFQLMKAYSFDVGAKTLKVGLYNETISCLQSHQQTLGENLLTNALSEIIASRIIPEISSADQGKLVSWLKFFATLRGSRDVAKTLRRQLLEREKRLPDTPPLSPSWR